MPVCTSLYNFRRQNLTYTHQLIFINKTSLEICLFISIFLTGNNNTNMTAARTFQTRSTLTLIQIRWCFRVVTGPFKNTETITLSVPTLQGNCYKLYCRTFHIPRTHRRPSSYTAYWTVNGGAQDLQRPFLEALYSHLSRKYNTKFGECIIWRKHNFLFLIGHGHNEPRTSQRKNYCSRLQ